MARSVSQLKNQARREEQRENWDRAIELYGEAIRLSEEAGKVSLDVSLYNRVGDLFRRQGDVGRAVHYYMEAVDRYAEQGLHTGAIALCNKIHRLAPDQVEVFRSLGRLYAATGLLAEARNSFRKYLDHVEEAGDEAACRDARLELARLTGDRELLLDVAGRMAEAGEEEREAALEALLDLWDRAGNEGDEELRHLLLEIDPGVELDAGKRARDDAGAEEAAPGPADAAEEGDGPGHVDLGERIRRRLEAEGAPDEAAVDDGPPDRDFDDMLVDFRVGTGDAEANPAEHVELGVALRQMGLLEDAIREFQAAIRSPEPPLRAFELLGEAFIEQGVHGVAVRVLTRALHLPGRSDHELLGVLYQLGIAHQTEANHDRALDCFERVYSIDIDFRDVADRMEEVRQEL